MNRRELLSRAIAPMVKPFQADIYTKSAASSVAVDAQGAARAMDAIRNARVYSRRQFAGGMALAGGGTVVAGAGVAVEPFIAAGYRLAREVVVPSDATKGEQKEVADALQFWTREVSPNPTRISEFRPEILDKALEYFQSETGQDAQALRPKINLLPVSDFVAKTGQGAQVDVVYSYPNDEIDINKDAPDGAKAAVAHTFFGYLANLYSLASHYEDYSKNPQKVDDMFVFWQKGVASAGLMVGSQKFAIKNRVFNTAIYLDASKRAAEKVISIDLAPQFNGLITAYRSSVLSLFGGNPDQVLQAFFNGNSIGIFQAVGERLGNQGDVVTQIAAGKKYIEDRFGP